jgi:hypothetical protein
MNTETSARDSKGHPELKQHVPLFDKGYSNLINKRKETELQWLQNLCQMNGGNLLSNIRHTNNRTWGVGANI